MADDGALASATATSTRRPSSLRRGERSFGTSSDSRQSVTLRLDVVATWAGFVCAEQPRTQRALDGGMSGRRGIHEYASHGYSWSHVCLLFRDSSPPFSLTALGQS